LSLLIRGHACRFSIRDCVYSVHTAFLSPGFTGGLRLVRGKKLSGDWGFSFTEKIIMRNIFK
jgi:hypothetical protein